VRNPNPESPIPNPLFACLYRPPALDNGRAAEAPARQKLAAIAQEFSPRYECHRDDLVSIDVSGLERLLGPARTIGEELRHTAAARGVRVHVAVAATRIAAIILAHARPGVTVVQPGGEADALAPLPVAILEKTDGTPSLQTSDFKLQTFPTLQRWGVKTLGELAALPPGDLASRLGRQALVWQAIARGDDVRPLVPTLDEERFESSLELEWPIEGLEPLSFVLTRLLEPLSTRLERRDRGAAVLHVILRLVTRESHASRLELPTPMRDVRALRTLALLDLESHPPAAAIDRVTIVIDPTPGRVLQHTLFTRAQPTPEQLSTLLARLGALMGQDRLGAPVPVDSYRPGAFTMAPFKTEHSAHAVSAESTVAVSSALSIASALRRCRQPVPARVAVENGRPIRVTTDRRGFVGGSVVRCAGPWRTSGNWWAGGAGEAGQVRQAGGDEPRSVLSAQPIPPFPPLLSSWNRDEWDVAVSDGAVYRIFQDRDTDAWFIDAVVD
jgi:protein ImuB